MKKLSLLYVFTIIIFFNLNAQNNFRLSESSNYYRNDRSYRIEHLDTYENLLSKENQNNIAVLKGRVENDIYNADSIYSYELEVSTGNWDLQSKTTFKVNSKGLLSEEITFDFENNIWELSGKEEKLYSDADDLIEINSFNFSSETSEWIQIAKTLLEYDENHANTSFRYFTKNEENSDLKYVWESLYENNNSGKRIECMTRRDFGDEAGFVLARKQSWKYSPDDKLLEAVFSSASRPEYVMQLFSKETFEYDEEGLNHKKNYFSYNLGNSEWEKTSDEIFEYSDNGFVLTSLRWDFNIFGREKSSFIENIYDIRDNRLSNSEYLYTSIEDRALISKNIGSYDEFNNQTEETTTFFDRRSSEINFSARTERFYSIGRVTSINDDEQNFIRLYPNPAADQLVIETNRRKTQLIIYGIKGEELINLEVTKKLTLDISGFPKGLYLYKYSIENSAETGTGKLIIN